MSTESCEKLKKKEGSEVRLPLATAILQIDFLAATREIPHSPPHWKPRGALPRGFFFCAVAVCKIRSQGGVLSRSQNSESTVIMYAG